MFGAGYASAEDRLFLMDVLRHTGRGRLTELVGAGHRRRERQGRRRAAQDRRLLRGRAPGDDRQRDDRRRRRGRSGQGRPAGLRRRHQRLHRRGARGLRARCPASTRRSGTRTGPTDWKPTDTVAIASLIGGIFGKGGGREAQAAQVLAAANERFGKRRGRGRAVFDDFRATRGPRGADHDAQAVPVRQPGPRQPGRGRRTRPRLAQGARPDRLLERRRVERRRWRRAPLACRCSAARCAKQKMSNALLIAGSESATGKPIAVMGPQVGYYSPQILMEMDLHGPGIDARGATFPGISLYILLGRGPDYAWSRDDRDDRRGRPVRGEALQPRRVGADDRVDALRVQGRVHPAPHARPGADDAGRADRPGAAASATRCASSAASTGRSSRARPSAASRSRSRRRGRPTSTSSSRRSRSSA